MQVDALSKSVPHTARPRRQQTVPVRTRGQMFPVGRVLPASAVCAVWGLSVAVKPVSSARASIDTSASLPSTAQVAAVAPSRWQQPDPSPLQNTRKTAAARRCCPDVYVSGRCEPHGGLTAAFLVADWY